RDGSVETGRARGDALLEPLRMPRELVLELRAEGGHERAVLGPEGLADGVEVRRVEHRAVAHGREPTSERLESRGERSRGPSAIDQRLPSDRGDGGQN